MDEQSQDMPQEAPEVGAPADGGMGEEKKSQLRVIVPIVVVVIVIAVIILLAV